jgi:hypothetical protein
MVPLNVQVTESPGPAAVSSRLLTINIVTPVQNSEYALTSGGLTYIELDQTTSTGTQTWRSIAGKLVLGQNDAKASIFTMQDVDFQPFTGGSVGTFRINGNVQVRF